MPQTVHSSQLIVHRSAKKTVNREPVTVNRRQRRLGFTLIEILLSLFLIMALAAMLFSSSATLVQSRSTNLQSQATKIASKDIECLRNTTFNSLPGTCTFAQADLNKLPQANATRTISNYQSSTKIKQVSEVITWQENNNPRQIKMDTLIYEYGL